MKRAWTWVRLLNRRLFRKAGFLVILLLVPILTAGLQLAAREESGLYTISLAYEKEDSLGAQLVSELVRSPSVLRFVRYSDAAAAEQSVLDGTADAAWCFPDDLAERLAAFSAGSTKPVMTIYQREESVFLRLARERLFCALYSELAASACREFVRREDPGTPDESTLTAEIRSVGMDAPLILCTYLNGNQTAETSEYLTAPVRGLLALLIMLCGFAAAIYRAQDAQAGAFTWLQPKGRRGAESLWVLLPMLDTAAVVFVALWVCGSFTVWWYELLLLLCLVLAGGGLCSLIGRVFRKPEHIGVAALILTVAMLALCPVFLNFRKLRPLQLLLPPYYYLHGLHNRPFALSLLLYAAAAWLLDALIAKLASRRVK